MIIVVFEKVEYTPYTKQRAHPKCVQRKTENGSDKNITLAPRHVNTSKVAPVIKAKW